MTSCMWKGSRHRDQLNRQFHFNSVELFATFSTFGCLGFLAATLLIWFTLTALISVVLGRRCCFLWEALKTDLPTVVIRHCTISLLLVNHCVFSDPLRRVTSNNDPCLNFGWSGYVHPHYPLGFLLEWRPVTMSRGLTWKFCLPYRGRSRDCNIKAYSKKCFHKPLLHFSFLICQLFHLSQARKENRFFF